MFFFIGNTYILILFSSYVSQCYMQTFYINKYVAATMQSFWTDKKLLTVKMCSNLRNRPTIQHWNLLCISQKLKHIFISLCLQILLQLHKLLWYAMMRQTQMCQTQMQHTLQVIVVVVDLLPALLPTLYFCGEELLTNVQKLLCMMQTLLK